MKAHVVLDESDTGWTVEAHHLDDRPVRIVTDGGAIHLHIEEPETADAPLRVTLDEPVAE